MFYYKIHGADNEGTARELYIKYLLEEKPNICDLILYAKENGADICEFSTIDEPEEISKEDFLDAVVRQDEIIFLKTYNVVNPIVDDRVLTCENNDDYALKPDQEGVWLLVDTISLRIRRTEDGVEVEAYPAKKEMAGSILIGSVSREDVAAIVLQEDK